MKLNLNQIDSLTDILYNTCSRWTMYERIEMGCYFPRNAIIFFDNTGKPFEYIEICFECQGMKTSSNNIEPADICDIMYKDLQAFFKNLGLKTSAIELFEKSHGR